MILFSKCRKICHKFFFGIQVCQLYLNQLQLCSKTASYLDLFELNQHPCLARPISSCLDESKDKIKEKNSKNKSIYNLSLET